MQATNYYRTGLDVGSTTAKMVILDKHGEVVFSRYERHNAQVNELLASYFDEAQKQLGCAAKLPLSFGFDRHRRRRCQSGSFPRG